MKIIGITAEYNPFHNGHKYHLDKSKTAIGADYVVAVMSGNFTQRGEAAILDKWERSKLAVENGVNLVIELPFVFACNRAEIFAAGAVDILAELGATHISFGSETGKLGSLESIVKDLEFYSVQINENKNNFMAEGNSYARSFQRAVEMVIGKEAAGIISTPNNILAVEYIRRIRGKNYKIEPVTIERHGSGYFEQNTDAGFAGATVIREMVFSGNGANTASYLPNNVYEALISEGFCCEMKKKQEERIFQLVRAEIIKNSSYDLSQIYCMGEGLENKLKKEIVKAGDLNSLISSVVSKRYTEAAIRRLMVYVLMGIKERHPEMTLYGRVLAADKKGRALIKSLKKEGKSKLPLITNINKETDICRKVYGTLHYDLLASDMYNLINDRNLYKFSDKVVTPYMM